MGKVGRQCTAFNHLIDVDDVLVIPSDGTDDAPGISVVLGLIALFAFIFGLHLLRKFYSHNKVRGRSNSMKEVRYIFIYMYTYPIQYTCIYSFV
jgi:hypothetical protein